jgi:hypothetical protein
MLPIEAHLLPNLDTLGHAVGRSIDMGRSRGGASIYRRGLLYSEAFEHILRLL